LEETPGFCVIGRLQGGPTWKAPRGVWWAGAQWSQLKSWEAMTGSRMHRMKGEGVRKTTELSGSDGPWQAGRKRANESVNSDWGEWALGLFAWACWAQPERRRLSHPEVGCRRPRL
jgi:hypothetical protein